jgi:hypothetical protein
VPAASIPAWVIWNRCGLVWWVAYPAAAIRFKASNTAPEEGAPIARVMSPTFSRPSGRLARYAATCGYRCPARRAGGAASAGWLEAAAPALGL